MTTAEITAAIKAKLAEAGIKTYPGDNCTSYDDSTSLVSVRAERNWAGDGECLVGIWEGYVQRWQQDTPFNYTKGFPVGIEYFYCTPDEMIRHVQLLRGVEKAACWQ